MILRLLSIAASYGAFHYAFGAPTADRFAIATLGGIACVLIAVLP